MDACVPGPVVRHCNAAVPRDESGSRPSGRGFVRLRGQDRFASVYRRGTRVRRGAITVIQAPSDAATPAVGVVASKRIGTAVRRNRAKRRMREAAARVALTPNTSYVVVAGDDLEDTPFDQIVAWMDEAVTEGQGEPS